MPSDVIPEAIREAMKTHKVKIGETEYSHGGADPNKRGILNLATSSPSVMQHNAYGEYLKQNMLGYVTFLGVDGPNGPIETAHQFESANGERRLLNRYISEPVYFAADWEHFKKQSESRNPIFLVSKTPLSPGRLERRGELRSKAMEYRELVALAGEYKIANAEELPREALVEQILNVEFKDTE